MQKDGFFFKKKFGQNFLNDQNLLSAIARDSGADETCCVLEIGAGAGALTKELAKRAKRVVAFEIDQSLKPILFETLSPYSNVELIFSDFLKADFSALEEKLGDYLVCSNLPYYLTTPVLMRFAEEGKRCRALIVMVQEEVARRFSAKAGTAEYGAATAALARRGTCTILRKVSREMFTPRPNVDSAVIKFDFTSGGFSVESVECYKKTLFCAFGNRRKTLVNNLHSVFSIPKERAEEMLNSLGLEKSVRGEALAPETLGKLSDLIFQIQKGEQT